MSTSPMTLTFDFQGQILKKSYLRNGMADWHGMKGMGVDRMLDSHCDFKLWPHPWPWLWIFKVKIRNCCNSGMGGLTHLEWKGCELDDVGCTMGLTLGHGAWQVDQPSNGSMWNSYSFQPVGQWMGYSFTAWWRHQMETFSALLAVCAGNSPVPGEFHTQRPVTRSFGVFFDLRLNKRLSKQSWGWWFETLSRSLWRHRNDLGAEGCCRSLNVLF